LRARLDGWLDSHHIRPQVAGEFEDSALLKAFAADGLGVFPAADILRQDLKERYGARRIGKCEGVHERFFAIGTERRVAHPLVKRLLAPGPGSLRRGR
jgi:LysR family transcriptional activator of nhaA